MVLSLIDKERKSDDDDDDFTKGLELIHKKTANEDDQLLDNKIIFHPWSDMPLAL